MAFYLETLKMNNSQQDNENKPAIFQEKNENLNRILYFIIAAVMLAPFFIFPHLDVKPFEDEDKVTLEQRLDYLPDVMTQLYQDATLIYQKKLPAYQYHQFTWITSTKSFAVDLPLSQLSLSDLQQEILPRYQQQGWKMVANDLAEPLTTGQTIRWIKNNWVAEVRYVDSGQHYWHITFRLRQR